MVIAMHTLLPSSGYRPAKQKVNVLAFVTAKIGPEVLPHLLHRPDLNVKVVSDCSKVEFQEYLGNAANISGLHWIDNAPVDPYKNQQQMQGHRLARWADLLFVIGDASMVSLMLAGLTTDVMLHAVRCWDTSKRILMLPELSAEQKSNPVWKRQMSKLQRKWEWVHVLEPATWNLLTSTDSVLDVNEWEVEPDCEWHWDGSSELLEVLHAETQMVLRKARALSMLPAQTKRSSSSNSALPPEIWTVIFDHLGDWEVATALDIYTHIPTPTTWLNLIPSPGSKTRSLEWIILTQPIGQVKAYFEKQPKERKPILSALALDIILRFARTDILTYLATHQKDVFWTHFSGTMLPHKASIIYNSPVILQWWNDCPAVIRKEYGPEAIDGASRAGFMEVLQWWLDSGLELRYTDRALENASSKGSIEVLEWWRTNNQKLVGTPQELPLKVGKSIWLAAQCGRAQSIAWWERSSIPYGHEERVATVASQGGHVKVLDLWYSLKGSKMIYDNQVLVGPTKHGYAAVLEWWKEASRKWALRVEYKTCDIEEAMEDAVGNGGEGEVREWWARNGLNLGVGTGEWMKVKTL